MIREVLYRGVLAPIVYVFKPQALGYGLTAGVAVTATEVGLQRWVAPGYFLLALLVGMTLELLSRYLGKSQEDRAVHNWEQVWIGKLFIIFLGVCALLLDGAFYFGSQYIPNSRNWAIIQGGFLPVTTSSLIWFITAEIARTVRNITQYEGTDTTLPPMIVWVIRQIRKEDASRYPGDGPPPRRRIDQLTEGDVRELIERGRQDPSDPPPLKPET